MARKRREGICHVCGQRGPLSKEHIPPKAAYNDCDVLLQQMEKEETESHGLLGRPRKQQGGYRRFVLCERCNNVTGAWYGAEYARLAQACALCATPTMAGRVVTVSIRTIAPIRVFKQALTIFAGSCDEGLTVKNPEIRSAILDPERPAYLRSRVYLYLKARGGGRCSGVSSQMNTQTKRSHVLAEFSWWPLGWVLSFDVLREFHLLDVTGWGRYGFHEWRPMEVEVPVLWNYTPIPLDFRSPDRVEKEARESWDERLIMPRRR